MEWEWEKYRTFVDPALQILEQFHHELSQIPPYLKNPIQTVLIDLRFFKMFLWGLAYWEESEQDWHLLSVMSTVGCKLRQAAKDFTAQCTCTNDGENITNWEQRSYHLGDKINQFKPQAKEICMLLLKGSFKCKSCQHEEMFLDYGRQTASFIGFILQNLQALNLKIDQISQVMEQLGFIQGKLKLFRNFAWLVNNWSTTKGKRLGELISHIRTWASHVSCLACLYWIDEMDESLTYTMGTMFSDLMKKSMPCRPEVIALYLDVLNVARYHKFEATVIPQLVAGYVDFLLEDLVIPKEGDIESLREGLIFLLSLEMDQTAEDLDDGKVMILELVDAIVNEVPSLICSIRLDEMQDNTFKTIFPDFLQKIARVEAEVRELCVMTPHSSKFNFPKTNAIGFIDCLLGKLKKMLEVKVNFNPFVMHEVEIVQEELVTLRRFLQNIMELQNKHEDIKDLWARIINVVYDADYVIKLSSVRDFPVWDGIIFLSIVKETIKHINIEVEEIDDYCMQKSKMLSAEMESGDALLPRATTSIIEGAFIGFEEDAGSIINHLIRGGKDLKIISISGMPGQGKTTLAKRIYNDPSVQRYFHKMMWCYVSKECTVTELLNKIVNDVRNTDAVPVLNPEIQDLAECLWKSLKGRRYLIVMDDIWDADLWHQVQGSFPDDSNGSRIVFTSRNHDLGSQAKQNSISHPLRLFSDGESLELMKLKLFHSDGFPPEFFGIGKQIAIYCKGLPLAVVLTAAILGRMEQKLDLWNQVAENLKSHLSSEECRNIIQLSYKYLPDHLKPCFLYFGAFQRGKDIHARKLKLLWIAEGFVQDNEVKCSEDLAKEYLDNLVCQNLVVVTERSSMGGIKKCNVHDLLYDMCLEKAVEENFLLRAEKSTVFDQCYSTTQKYNHHRLCIGRNDPFIKPRPLCTRRELPTSHVHSLLWFYNDYSGRPTYESISCFFKSFKILTVLDLEEVSLQFSVFPSVILSLIHLRFLSLCCSIERIPQSITDLWNLETLIVRSSLLSEPLPDCMWEMESLRHVDIDRCRLHLEGFEQNESSIAACNIVALSGPILHYSHKTIKYLRKLTKLRKLHCYYQQDTNPKWFSMLGSLKTLESLRIDYEYLSGYYDFMGKSPKFNFPANLKKLTLKGLDMQWSAIKTVGKHLPNLEVLKLLMWACRGHTWKLKDGEFSKLRYLKLKCLDIRRINVSHCDNPFPWLEELVVQNCVRLEKIPSSFGDICTLRTIKLLGSSSRASASVSGIFEQQRDIGNYGLQVFVETYPDRDDDNENDYGEGEEEEEDDDDDDKGGEDELELMMMMTTMMGEEDEEYDDDDDDDNDEGEEDEEKNLKTKKKLNEGEEEAEKNLGSCCQTWRNPTRTRRRGL